MDQDLLHNYIIYGTCSIEALPLHIGLFESWATKLMTAIKKTLSSTLLFFFSIYQISG